MSQNKTSLKNDVCPPEKAGSLTGLWRKILQNPRRILKKYVRPGMTVLDYGCGPGFFTIEAAKMVGDGGKVIAADLQPEMLDMVRRSLAGKEYEKRVELHRCEADSIGVAEKIDFALMFYVAHELPDMGAAFAEIFSALNPGGILFVVEPNFHVSKDDFTDTIEAACAAGFEEAARPFFISSRAVALQKAGI